MEKLNEKKYLNDGLSEALMNHVVYDDIAEVAKETGVSISTLLSVRKQKAIVTERSEKAVDRLLLIAYKNADSTEKEAKKCKKSLKSFI